MRLFLLLFLVAAAIVAGLYVYGQMLEPNTRVIEVEALDVEE